MSIMNPVVWTLELIVVVFICLLAAGTVGCVYGAIRYNQDTWSTAEAGTTRATTASAPSSLPS